MNVGLATSSVIAGILLTAILALNIRMGQESDYTVMNQITKQNLNIVTNALEHDFKKIGYGAVPPKILSADSTTLKFKSDIDNDNKVDTLTWSYTTTEDTSTQNPDDYILKRIRNGSVSSLKLGVTHFNMTFLDTAHQETTTPSEIARINVSVVCQSPDPIDEEYITSSWEKLYVPWNLQN